MHRVGVLHNRAQLSGIKSFMQAQRTSDAIESFTVLSEQADRSIIGPHDDAMHFLVDDHGRLLAILVRASCQGSPHEWIVPLTKGDRSQALAHTPAGDHLARNGGAALQGGFSAGRDVSNWPTVNATAPHS